MDDNINSKVKISYLRKMSKMRDEILHNVVQEDLESLRFKFLENLGEMNNDEMMELAMDPEIVMGLLEISLYPSEEVGRGFNYSKLATELLCTSVFLDVLISGYAFGIYLNNTSNSNSVESSDFGTESDSDSDSEIESSKGLHSNSAVGVNKMLNFKIEGNQSSYSDSNNVLNLEDVENRLDRIYAMPISVLIAFILDDDNNNNNDEYLKEFGIEYIMVGISNFSKIVYSLLIYDYEWTWKYIFSTRNGKFILNLTSLIHYPSIFHLLKFIILILSQDNDNYINDHEKLNNGTEIKLEDIIKSLCQNLESELFFQDLRLLEEPIKKRGFGSNGLQLIKSTCEFLIDLFHGFLDLTQVFDHFNFEYIKSDLTPLSFDTKLSRRIIKNYYIENNNLNNKLNNIEKKVYQVDILLLKMDITHELLINLVRSIQSLDFIIRNNTLINLEDLDLCSVLVSGLILLVNTGIKLEIRKGKNPRILEEKNKYKKRDDKSIKSIFGVKTSNWMNDLGHKIWNLSNQLRNSEIQGGIIINPIKLLLKMEKQVPNLRSRLKIINFEMIKIIRNYIWGILVEVCLKEEEDFTKVGNVFNQSRRGYLVSIIIEILDYIEVLIDFEDIELLRGLIEETISEENLQVDNKNQKTRISIIWEILDVIIFQSRINNLILDEKLLKIFKACMNHFLKEKKSILGCKENYSKSNKFTMNEITCTRKYFVLGYLKSSWFLSYIIRNKRSETWMDDRIMRRTMNKTGMSNLGLFRFSGVSKVSKIENTYENNKLGNLEISSKLMDDSNKFLNKKENNDDSNDQGVSEYLYKELKLIQEDSPWISHYLWNDD